RRRLSAAVDHERCVGVKHRHQFVDVAGGVGVAEATHDLLGLVTRDLKAWTRITKATARACENLPRVRLALADGLRNFVEVELEYFSQQEHPALGRRQ